MSSTMPGELEGRKRVRLRLRRNLEMTLQTRGGKNCYVAKDPITLRYFHLDEAQRFITRLMDGTNTLEDIRQAYESSHRPVRMTLDELETFARQMLENGLVVNESPGAARPALEQVTKQRRKRLLSLLNVFYIKIPLANPDRWMKRLEMVGTAVFSSFFLAASTALFLGALGLLALHWQEFLGRLPSYREFFSLQTLFLFWLTLGAVKVLHELAHAFCCKRMGADVQEIGVLILFFFPTLYCNVSDSWTLPSKWKRIAVSAAGIYIELIIASLATFLWWFSDSNSFVHNLCFALMTVCSVNTLLCNANPLMRFDGYYIVSDWLEIPNLAHQASQVVGLTVLRWLGVPSRQADTPRAGFLFWFGVGSAVYRWYVMALTLYVLSECLKQHHLAGLGSMLVVASLVMLVGTPLYQFIRWLHQLGRFPEMKTVRVWLSVTIVLALAASFALIPFPSRVRGVALVQVIPEHMQRVVIPETEGFLQDLRVRGGQRVKAGDILAVLENPKLEIKIRLNEADQELRYQQQNAFIAQLADVGNPKEDTSADWQRCEQELQSLAQQHRTLKEQRDRLVLRAPVAGVVMGLPPLEDKGKWLDKATELCRIGSDDALRVLVLLDAADHGQVRPNTQARIRIHGAGSRQYLGAVTGIAQVESRNIPPPLSSRIAGDIPTQHDAATNTDKPHGQHYLVSVHFNAVDTAVHAGVLGRVMIETEPQTLWWQLRRYLGTTLNWGL